MEAPKGSLVKLKYEIKLGAFTVAHSLPLGLSYRFEWGFVPSTQASDGDPLDILILHEASTYPGVVLPCRPLGVVEMDQEEKDGKRERNDRVIVMPAGKIAEVSLRLFEYDVLYSEKARGVRMEGSAKEPPQ